MEKESMSSMSFTKKRPPGDTVTDPRNNDTPMTKRSRLSLMENETSALTVRFRSSEKEDESAVTPPAKAFPASTDTNDLKPAALLMSSPGDGMLTVEDLLTVPLDCILRKVPTGSSLQSPSTPRSNGSFMRNGSIGRPLLSRTEASLLLRVQALAQEVDALTEAATIALAQRVRGRNLAASLERTDHPFLRPLVATLYAIHETQPTQTVQQIAGVLEKRVIPEFRRIVPQIRQCSEHNWTLADTLEDTGGGGALAEEKRKLSDVQEEVCQRIESTFLLLTSSHQISTIQSGPSSSQPSSSMKEYCDRMFQPSVADAIPESIGNRDSPAVPLDDSRSSFLSNTLLRNCDEEEEVLDDEPPPSMPASPVSSPEETPTFHQATDATKNTIRSASTPVLTPPMTTTPASRVVDSSSSRRCSLAQDSIALFQDEIVEEKENAPSQSSSCSRRSRRTSTSSQHSSQPKRPSASVRATPPAPVDVSVLEGATSLAEDDPPISDDFFRSQGAAEVLSTLAQTSMTRSVTGNLSPS